MLLAENIHMALGSGADDYYEGDCYNDVNFADIYCDDSIKEAVKDSLIRSWVKRRRKDWREYLLERIGDAEKVEDIMCDPNPDDPEEEFNSNYSEKDVHIYSTDFGFTFDAGRFYVDADGSCCVPDLFMDGFVGSLKKLKKEFPSIKYYAYIGYLWSDERGGDVER